MRGGCGQKFEERMPTFGEEALPRLEECNLENVSRLYEAKAGVGRDGFHPKVPLDFTKETRGENREVSREGGAEWPMAATTLHDDIFLGPEECHE